MVCIDPAMCKCVWLMIVVVCRLGEEYGCRCVGVGMCGCPGRWARGICFLL